MGSYCASPHPDKDVTCEKGPTNHPMHTSRYGQGFIDWTNDDYSPPEPKKTYARRAPSKNKGLLQDMAQRTRSTIGKTTSL